MYTCPACGFVQHQATRYCPNCGRRLGLASSGAILPSNVAERAESRTYEQRGTGGRLLFSAAVVVALLVAAHQTVEAPTCQAAESDVQSHHSIIWGAIDSVATVQLACSPWDPSALAAERHVTVQWRYRGTGYQASYVVTATDDVQPANQLARQIDSLSSSASVSTLLGLLR